MKYADILLPTSVFNDEENKFLLEISEDESLAMKTIGDIVFYGADPREADRRPCQGLRR